MSAILGIFAADGAGATDDEVRGGLEAMRSRGGELVEIWRDADAVLGVARQPWETSAAFGGAAAIAVSDRYAVVADAGLYYRDDLRRALAAAHVRPASDTPAALILAAFEAWGEECAAHLEGDFAFLVWDRRARRVIGARDFVGMRALYYASLGDSFIAASTIGGVLACRRCPSDLNWFAIGNAVARLFGATHETCYAAVNSLLAGFTLVTAASGPPRTSRHWTPPPIGRGNGPPFTEAAVELRRLLTRAVAERAPDGETGSVWLSGGYDSTAIFAVGQERLRAREDGAQLRAVSMSYPEGDTGNEDATIRSVAAFWNQPVQWVHSADVPMFGDEERRAARRDNVFSHPFEMWQRAMARGSRAVDARIALQGIGGDELFAGTDLYLADMFRGGRWLALSREWNARVRRYGFRYFVRQAVVPTLGPTARRAVALLRGGKPLADAYAFRPPTWMRADFVRTHDLEGRETACVPRLENAGFAEQQAYQCMTHQCFGVIRPPIFDFGVEEGVELRLPLFDRRVVEFAAPRPAAERLSGEESKRLLRASVRGLLPDDVLAPRRNRTGMTSGYFDQWMRKTPPAWMVDVMTNSLLAQFGVIDERALRGAWTEYQATGSNELGTLLYATLQTELWLRNRESPFSGSQPRERVIARAG
ncbi:MAG: asparagine synthase-related protein [Gemmatimonadaceae bacterium]